MNYPLVIYGFHQTTSSTFTFIPLISRIWNKKEMKHFFWQNWPCRNKPNLNTAMITLLKVNLAHLRIVIAFYGHTVAGGYFICQGDIMLRPDCSFVSTNNQTNQPNKPNKHGTDLSGEWCLITCFNYIYSWNCDNQYGHL